MKKAMSYYAAIDLHSNNLIIEIFDAQGRRIKHARLFCELRSGEFSGAAPRAVRDGGGREHLPLVLAG